MEFPLIEHELARLGRRKATYGLRTACIALAVAGMGMAAFFAFMAQASGQAGLAEGFDPFGIAFVIQFGVVALLTPVLAATAIAREKQDKTIGLLALAEFRGAQVYLSKVASVFIAVGSLVMVLMPFSVMGLLYGDVTPGSFLYQVFAIVAAIALIVAIGLWCSTIAERPADAVLITYIVVAVWFSMSGRLITPVYSWFPDTVWLHNIAQFINNIVFPVALAGALAAWTVRRLGAMGDEEPVVTKRRKHRRADSGDVGAKTVYRAAVRCIGSSWLSPPRSWWTAGLGLLLGVFAYEYLAFGIQWLVLFVIAYDMMSTLDASRRQGTLDTLACTPTDDRPLTRALIRVHLERAMVFYPLLVAVTIMGYFNAPAPLALAWGTPEDIALNCVAIVSGLVQNFLTLLLTVVLSFFAIVRFQTTARRYVSIVLQYLVASFISGVFSMIATTITVAATVGFTPNPAAPPGPSPQVMAVVMGGTMAVVLPLVIYGYYNLVVERVRMEWRNGAGARTTISPNMATTWRSL